MHVKDLLLSQHGAAQWLIEEFTKDIGDTDAAFQPCPGGNHLNWILVHLAVTEDSIVSKVGGGPKQLSEQLHKAYGGGSPCDANDGMTLAESRKIFRETAARTCAFIKTFSEAKYDEPAPADSPPMFKTLGEYLALLGTHPFWHFGQFTVNRRLLKKPMVFPMQP